MKKCYLPFVLLVCSLSARSQAYIPFPANMVIYGYSHVQTSMGDEYWYPHRTEISSDTVISGNHYSIVHSGTSPVDITGGIRNDVPGKKVYFFSFSTGTEKLLYDFDLSIGDTINASSGYGFYDPLVSTPELPVFATLDTAWVTSIDSIYMPHDGLYHKRFRFNGIYNGPSGADDLVDTTDYFWMGSMSGSMIVTSLVEGVGQLYNPLSNYGEFEFAYDYGVWCASINGVSVVTPGGAPPPFMNSSYCNQLYAGINENELEDFRLFPNPVSDKLKIECFQKIRDVEILDLTGRQLMYSGFNSNEAELDISELSQGVYFVRINNILVKRIIRQ